MLSINVILFITCIVRSSQHSGLNAKTAITLRISWLVGDSLGNGSVIST